MFWRQRVDTGRGSGQGRAIFNPVMSIQINMKTFVKNVCSVNVLQRRSALVAALLFGGAKLACAATPAGTFFIGYGDSPNVQAISPAGVDQGTYGTIDSPAPQYSVAGGITTDSAGNLYVLDSTFTGITKFDNSGQNQGSIAFNNTNSAGPNGLRVDAQGNFYVSYTSGGYIEKYSSTGSDLGRFATVSQPQAINFDSSGDLFVSSGRFNSGSFSIQEFTPTGTLLQTITNSNLNGPRGLSISNGVIYVTNINNSTVSKFDATSGTYLGNVPFNVPNNGLSGPVDVMVDPQNDVFVLNQGSKQIFEYSASGVSTLVSGAIRDTAATGFALEPATVPELATWMGPTIGLLLGSGCMAVRRRK